MLKRRKRIENKLRYLEKHEAKSISHEKVPRSNIKSE